MRIYPSGEFINNETIEAQKTNKSLTSAAATVNGSLTGINFAPETVVNGEQAIGTFQTTTIFEDAGPHYLTNGDINGGIYIVPQYTQTITWEDGMVVGALNIVYRKWDSSIPTTLTFKDITPNFVRWFLYVDGNIVAETDRIYTRDYTICLPFAFQTTAGSHEISVGIEATEFSATDAIVAGVAQPTYQMYLGYAQMHFRNVKR